MKHSVVLVVACLLLSTAAFASGSMSPFFIPEIMRGGTVVGNPSQSIAWSGNPAALAGEKADAAAEGPAMDNAASFAINLSGDEDVWALSYGGRSMVKGWGIGVGYVDADYSEAYGLGFGMPVNGFEVGINWRHTDIDSHYPGVNGTQSTSIDDTQDLFDLAARKVWTYGADDTSLKGLSKMALGAVVRDVTDEVDSTVDLGVSLDFTGGWTFNLDLLDFDTLNLGASTRVGSAKEWEVGAGLADGDLTLGAVYDIAKDGEPTAWRVGIAWADYDWDDIIYGGVSYNW